MPVNKVQHPRIALLTGTYPPCHCGVGQYTKRLQGNLEAEGVGVKIITTKREGLPEGVNTLRRWSPFQFTILKKIIVDNKIDIVHLQYPTTAYGKGLGLVLLMWMLKFFSNTKIFITVHEFKTYSWKGRLKIWLMMLIAVQIIVPDKSFVQATTRLLFISKNKIHTIPVGSNIEIENLSQQERDEKRAAKGLRPTDLAIGFWGYLEPSKGLRTLLQSLKMIQERGRVFKLALLSSTEPLQEISDKQDLINSEYRVKIKNFLLDNFADENILQPVGYDDQTIAEELALVDLFILPFTEGATSRRSTLITVINNNRPVISTRADQEDKLLKDLWLVKPNSKNELAKAIEKIIEKPELLEELKKRSLKASQNFSWKNIAKQHESLYTKFAKQNKQADANFYN